jgi:hypothetical protein
MGLPSFIVRPFSVIDFARATGMGAVPGATAGGASSSPSAPAIMAAIIGSDFSSTSLSVMSFPQPEMDL